MPTVDLLVITAIIAPLLLSVVVDAIQTIRKKAPVFLISPYLKLYKETSYLWKIVYSAWGKRNRKYVALQAIKVIGSNTQRYPLSDIINLYVNKNKPLLLLGQPGAGKTTAIEFSAYQIARRGYIFNLLIWFLLSGFALGFLWLDPLLALAWLCAFIIWQPIMMRKKIPIIVRGNEINNLDDYESWKQKTLSTITGCVNCRGIEKHVIWLIDGMNEISADAVEKFIRGWKSELDKKIATYVFTSREVENPSDHLGLNLESVHTICDLDEEGIQKFHHIYTSQYSPTYFSYRQTEEKEKKTREFVELLRQRGLLNNGGIARNPLWLKTIIESNYYSRNKGELFRVYTKKLLSRELNVDKNTFSRQKYPSWRNVVDEWEEMRGLSHLALSMHLFDNYGKVGFHNENEWIHARGAIKEILGSSPYTPDDVIWEAQAANILRVIPGKTLEFAHQQIQEFFSAYALTNRGLWDIAIRNCEQVWWWQTMFFLAGLLDEKPGEFGAFLQAMLDCYEVERLKKRLFVALGMLVSVDNPNSDNINIVLQTFVNVYGLEINRGEQLLSNEMIEKLGEEAAIAFSYLYFDIRDSNRLLGARLLCTLKTPKSASLILEPINSEMGSRVYSRILSNIFDEILFVFIDYVLGKIERSPKLDLIVWDAISKYPAKFDQIPSLIPGAKHLPEDPYNQALLAKVLGLFPTKQSIQILIWIIQAEVAKKTNATSSEQATANQSRPINLDYTQTLEALTNIAQLTPSIVDQIYEMLYNDEISPILARGILRKLMERHPAIASQTIHHLEDVQPECRQVSIDVLTDLQDPDPHIQLVLLELFRNSPAEEWSIEILDRFEDLAKKGNLDKSISAQLMTILIGQLGNDDNQEMRNSAIELLSLLDYKPGFEVLTTNMINDQNDHIRAFAIRALLAFDREQIVVPILLDRLISDDSSRVRVLAASGLSRYKSEEITAVLIRAMKIEKATYVKDEILISLLLSNPKSITKDVYRFIEWDDQFLIFDIKRIENICPPELMDHFLQHLEKTPVKGFVWGLEEIELKDPRILKAFIKNFLFHGWHERKSIQKVFLKYGIEFIPNALKQMEEMKLPSYNYRAALKTLAEIAGLDLVAETCYLLENRNPDLRQGVAYFYAKQKQKDAVKYLLKALVNESDFHVKLTMIDALGEIGDPEAIPYLANALVSEEFGSIRLPRNIRNWQDAASSIEGIGKRRNRFICTVMTAIEGINHAPDHVLVDNLNTFLLDSDNEISRNAILLLCKLSDDRGVEPLVKGLLSDDGLGGVYGMYKKISELPSEIKEKAIVLLRKYKEIPEYTNNAQDWLSVLSPDKPIEYYVQSLKSDNVYERNGAVWSLLKIKGWEAMPLFEAAITQNRNLWPGWSSAHEAIERMKYMQQNNSSFLQGDK